MSTDKALWVSVLWSLQEEHPAPRMAGREAEGRILAEWWGQGEGVSVVEWTENGNGLGRPSKCFWEHEGRWG